MTQANRPDSWDASSRHLLTIKSKAGTARHFRTTIVSTDKSGGTKDFDVIYNYANGCIKKHNDVTPVELTFEGYAVEVGTGTGTEGLGFDDLMNTPDATQPLSIPLDNTRAEYIVVFSKTTDSTATDAMAASTEGARAQRAQFKNGHFTDVAWNDTDGKVMKYTLKYKVAPFDRSGTQNVIYESTDGTSSAVLPLITYTA